MYRVELSQKAQKFLDGLDRYITDRIKDRLKRLKDNPVPSDAKFIKRDEYGKIFRYRIGSYRTLYRIKEIEKVILIAKIDKRSRVYDR